MKRFIGFISLLVLTGCIAYIGVPVDRGLMVRGGSIVHPKQLPWELVALPEHAPEIEDALSDLNRWIGNDVIIVHVSIDRFLEVIELEPTDRVGVATIRVGETPLPGEIRLEHIDDDIDEILGLTTNHIDVDGAIISADILISDRVHGVVFRDVVLHEAGHLVGLDHDDRSLNMGSCMSNPPEYACKYTDQDIGIIRGFLL